MITFAGFGIFFMADQAKWRASEEEVKKIGQMELYKLEYDIPDNAEMYDDETHPWRHPSDYLWSLGVRSTRSCWILPHKNIPWQRLNRLTEVGANWSCFKQDTSETANLIDACCKAIQREYVEAVERAQEVQQRGEVALEAGNQNPELTEEKIKKAHLIRAKRLKKSMEERFKDLEAGAAVFGLNVNYFGMADAANTIAAVNMSMAQRAATFAKAIQVAQAPETATSDTTHLAEAMKQDASIAPILADALQEAGQEEMAETLRMTCNAINGATEPAGDDNGVYSLSELEKETPEDPYEKAILTAKHEGTLASVREAFEQDRSILAPRRVMLRRIYQERMDQISQKAQSA
jgi:hypothetical protein